MFFDVIIFSANLNESVAAILIVFLKILKNMLFNSGFVSFGLMATAQEAMQFFSSGAGKIIFSCGSIFGKIGKSSGG